MLAAHRLERATGWTLRLNEQNYTYPAGDPLHSHYSFKGVRGYLGYLDIETPSKILDRIAIDGIPIYRGENIEGHLFSWPGAERRSAEIFAKRYGFEIITRWDRELAKWIFTYKDSAGKLISDQNPDLLIVKSNRFGRPAIFQWTARKPIIGSFFWAEQEDLAAEQIAAISGWSYQSLEENDPLFPMYRFTDKQSQEVTVMPTVQLREILESKTIPKISRHRVKSTTTPISCDYFLTKLVPYLKETGSL